MVTIMRLVLFVTYVNHSMSVGSDIVVVAYLLQLSVVKLVQGISYIV